MRIKYNHNENSIGVSYYEVVNVTIQIENNSIMNVCVRVDVK